MNSASSTGARTDGVSARDLENPPETGDHLRSNIENKKGNSISPILIRCRITGDVKTIVNPHVSNGTKGPSTGVEAGMNGGGQTVSTRSRAHSGAGDADDGSQRKQRRVELDTLGPNDVDTTESHHNSRQVAPEEENMDQKSARLSSLELVSSLREHHEMTPDSCVPPTYPCMGETARPSSTSPHYRAARALGFDNISEESSDLEYQKVQQQRTTKCRPEPELSPYQREVPGAINHKPDDAELWLLSQAAVLRRLPLRKQAEVKMKIQQLLFSAEFDK